MKKEICIRIFLVACLCILTVIFASMVQTFPSRAAKKTTDQKIVSEVKKAYGKNYGLGSKDKINTKIKNVFGGYSSVLGVSTKYFSKYTAFRHADSSEERICFVCEGKNKKEVATIVKNLKTFVSNEKKSNENYFSDKGKKLLNHAAVGSKGKYVYLFVLDTSGNKKAVSTFKKLV